jgi:peroxiredoxin
MVLTPSMMTRLGTPAPDFKLKDVVKGREYTLASFAAKRALLVIFMCKHCPYVQHIQEEISRFLNDYRNRDLAIVGISANDAANYPNDSPENLKGYMEYKSWDFPLLYDETQEVAKAYQAACTPDFFLYNKERKLAYRGQLDDARPGNGKPPTGRDLREAADAVLANRKVSDKQKASIGCNIKWKKGNEPSYFGKN